MSYSHNRAGVGVVVFGRKIRMKEDGTVEYLDGGRNLSEEHRKGTGPKELKDIEAAIAEAEEKGGHHAG